VTYADNRAVEFFKKNGFAKLKGPKKYGFKNQIEEYKQATLMAFEFDESTMSNGAPYQFCSDKMKK